MSAERRPGWRVTVEEKGAIKHTVVETPLYRALRCGKNLGLKVGKDFAEFLRVIPWRNRMFQTFMATVIWYKAGEEEINAFFNQIQTKLYSFEAVASEMTPLFTSEPQSAPTTLPSTTPTVVPTVTPQEIVIPPQQFYYEVRKGDTLYSIARRFGTTVEVLAEANQIFNQRLIYSGQILYVVSHVSIGEVIHDLLTPEERLKADKSYESIYYHPGELNSSPGRQEGLVHVYGLGEPLNPNYASGFSFQREEFVCATWFYPIGTWLKVTNVTNNEVVYCRVKDRGPNRVKYSDIIADLTKGARDEIAPSWVGEIQVTIEPAK